MKRALLLSSIAAAGLALFASPVRAASLEPCRPTATLEPPCQPVPPCTPVEAPCQG